MRRALVVTALAALVTACDAAPATTCADACAPRDAAPAGDAPPADVAARPDAALPPPVRPGLTLRGRVVAPPGGTGQTEGHLDELLAVGDDVYVANAQDAVAAFALRPDGAVTSTHPLADGIDPRRPPMCTTMALHAGTGTLYCAYALEGRVATYRVAPGQRPRLVDARALEAPQLGARGLSVAGDRLYVAALRNGLWSATIGADGALRDARDTGLGGDVRFVHAEADGRVVALDAERGLVLARAEGAAVRETARVALEGPRLGLAVRGDSALVALGSNGAAVIDLAASPPAVRVALRPPGVVTSVDREGDLVAVLCTSGVFLYDVAGASPRLVGFDPSRAVGMHLRFHRGELLVADWTALARYAYDRAGAVASVDVGWGSYDAPGARSVVAVRSVGDARLRARVQAFGRTLGDRVLDPSETWRMDFPAELLRDDGGLLVAILEVRSGEGECPAACRETRVVQRGSGGSRRPRPAVGEAMPSLVLARPEGGTVTVPEAGRATRVVFWSSDCAAMWPEVEDLEWLARVGRVPEGAAPWAVSAESPARSTFLTRWRFSSLRFAYYGGFHDEVPAAVADSSARYGGDVYEGGFIVDVMLSGARHPTDYTVDAQGVVRAVERIYRGAFPLR